MGELLQLAEFPMDQTLENVELGFAVSVSSGEASLADPSCSKTMAPPEPDEQAGTSSSSVYHSTRVEGMARSRTEFATALDFDIEASKDHWSELQPRSGKQPIEEGRERVVPTMAEILESLRRRYPQSGEFFSADLYGLVEVGKKIAEGAQAEIFEARISNDKPGKFVLKVFKEGATVMDLQKQWPLEMLNRCADAAAYGMFSACSPVLGGLVLRNSRFGFWMFRFAGDLRKLLDLRMERNNCQCAPLSDAELVRSMEDIARGMKGLHEDNIVHRDLKASNVLVTDREGTKPEGVDCDAWYRCFVADFECSVGVVGTGFWRAPEILQGVKDRKVTPNLFTKEADVYSYAMTCYEMITGRLPFERVMRNDYDVVLREDRPNLPKETMPWIKELLSRCWHANPLKRPRFEEIHKCIIEHSEVDWLSLEPSDEGT